jgi:hypothetical protein
MPAELPDDPTINELLGLAGVSTADPAARRWLGDALAAARATATGEPRPSPAKHNAPLDTIKRATDRLIAALDRLRRHPHAYESFWSYAAFGPIRADKLERADVMSSLKNVRHAAQKMRMSKIGRPPNLRKQHIVDLALAFCARFSNARPSSDVKNFFPSFAERFFEHSTGLSVEDKGHGISRQIRVALKRLPIEMERAALLNKTRRN